MLEEKDIRVGGLIWYHGSTSMSGWDCPAEIIEVNQASRWFRVRSLDDLAEQSQHYTFDLHEHSPDSRRNMRTTTRDDVMKYVLTRKHAAEQSKLSLEIKAREAAERMEKFERFMATL